MEKVARGAALGTRLGSCVVRRVIHSRRSILHGASHGAGSAPTSLRGFLQGGATPLKMGLTGVGVLVLEAVARARLFRIMRVGALPQGLFVAYVALIAYERGLLHAIL
jgi:hypothetical protein